MMFTLTFVGEEQTLILIGKGDIELDYDKIKKRIIDEVRKNKVVVISISFGTGTFVDVIIENLNDRIISVSIDEPEKLKFTLLYYLRELTNIIDIVVNVYVNTYPNEPTFVNYVNQELINYFLSTHESYEIAVSTEFDVSNALYEMITGLSDMDKGEIIGFITHSIVNNQLTDPVLLSFVVDKNKKIPKEMKEYVIKLIQNNDNISNNMKKNSLITIEHVKKVKDVIEGLVYFYQQL